MEKLDINLYKEDFVKNPFKYINNNLFSELDINMVNDKKENALFYSDLENSKKLIDLGINVNQVNKFGRTSIFSSDFDKTKLLIDSGADVNHTDNSGRNALFVSDYETSILLVENGIDFDNVTNEGKNALFHCYDLNKLIYLIDLGVQIDKVDNKNRNCLHVKNHIKPFDDVFKYLVDIGLYCDSIFESNDCEKMDYISSKEGIYL